MKRNEKKRIHLVNLFRWRSTVAFAACLITILFSLGGVGYSFVSVTLKEVREMFKWFTIDSNILTALAATILRYVGHYILVLSDGDCGRI